MPVKKVKVHGKVVVVKSVVLANGNLLIPEKFIAPDGSRYADWVEVMPGTPAYKRWLPVSSHEPDPRLAADYVTWKAALLGVKHQGN